VSESESSEVVVPVKRGSSEHFGPELTETPAPPASGRADREGLPTGYRMRADAHYVDSLTARRQERAERDRGEAGRAAADTVDAGVDAERRDRILAQLHEELTTLASATAMLGNSTAVARRLGTDLVRAQTWKALWLVKACTLVDGRERPQLRARPIGPLVEQIRQGLSAECRLAGATRHVSATDWSATPSLDEAVLVAGVTGAVLATLAVLGNQDGPAAIRVAFDTSGTELRTVEVSQDDVPVPPASAARFFDPAWTDRPGGWLAAVGALTARLAAQQHGGSAACLAGERRGTTIRLSFAKLH
jgi:hypothetical protein